MIYGTYMLATTTATATNNANTILSKIGPYAGVAFALAIIGGIFKLVFEYFSKRGAERAKVVDEIWHTLIATVLIGAGLSAITAAAIAMLGISGINVPGL